MLDRAHAADKGVMIGSQAASGLGTVHAAIRASRTEVTHPSELSFPLRLGRGILEGGLTYEGGTLRVADLAEVRLRRDAVDAFAG